MIVNHKPCQFDSTLQQVWLCIKFVYSMVYSLQQIVVIGSQVYSTSTLDSLQQIVATYIQATDQSVNCYTFVLVF